MLGLGEHHEAQAVPCPICQTPMQNMGGQMATDGEEAFEKKMAVGVYVCPQCAEVSLNYRGGL